MSLVYYRFGPSQDKCNILAVSMANQENFEEKIVEKYGYVERLTVDEVLTDG